jgi:hypothetical protein
MSKTYKYNVIDWGDDAYRKNNKEEIICTIELSKPLDNICFDGGRLEIEGWEETIYIKSSQFAIHIVKDV